MERFQETLKNLINFLGDLGKDLRWSVFCVQEFAPSTGEMVTETAKGHQVFATSPCLGQS